MRMAQTEETRREGSGRRSRGRAAWSRLAAVALAAPLMATPAAAQPTAGMGAEQGLTLSRANLGIFTGLLAPLNDLTSDPGSFGTAVSVSPVVGADAAFWFGKGRFGLGLQALFGPADLKAEPTEFQGAIPDDLGKAHYLAGTASLLYRLQLPGARGRVEPYFGIGAGVRRLSVEAIAEPEVEDVTDPIGTLAAGTQVWFSHRLAIRFEVRDHLSDFESPTTGESRLQNDVMVTVGLGTRIR